MENFAALEEQIKTCDRCPLHAKRLHTLAGEGNAASKVMLIGEAPGEQEDLSGRVFVGPAGQLLDKILAAINLRREDIYITNILKCRPPGNRSPSESEISACMPWLCCQVEIINPKIILCLGKVAANALLGNKRSLSSMRGITHSVFNSQLITTYHPAALLRNPQWKRACWEDVKRFRSLYDELLKSTPAS